MFEYIVRPGDTLVDIANYYDVSVEYIMAANPKLDPENLIVGTRVVIPASTVTRALRRAIRNRLW